MIATPVNCCWSLAARVAGTLNIHRAVAMADELHISAERVVTRPVDPVI
jgi:hypothetical protein